MTQSHSSHRKRIVELRAQVEALREQAQQAQKREQEGRRAAYLQSPEGAEMERRLVVLTHRWMSSIHHFAHPELQTREDPCPRCGDRAIGPHMCGPKQHPDEITAAFQVTVEQAQQEADAWWLLSSVAESGN